MCGRQPDGTRERRIPAKRTDCSERTIRRTNRHASPSADRNSTGCSAITSRNRKQSFR
jgi:hypothetical protein